LTYLYFDHFLPVDLFYLNLSRKIKRVRNSPKFALLRLWFYRRIPTEKRDSFRQQINQTYFFGRTLRVAPRHKNYTFQADDKYGKICNKLPSFVGFG